MSSKDDITKDRLIYTCNCGWIDLNHMEDPSTRAYVGAKNLWKQLNDNEAVAIANRPCLVSFGAAVVTYNVSDYATFPDGSVGYKVTYKQDMGNRFMKTDVTRSYLVKYGLTLEQKKSVALSIFMEVSKLFEDHQGSFPWLVVTSSGFSAEDLVSNLLGFYISIGEQTKESTLKLCHPVSKETSLKIWDRDGSIEEIKNKEFEPILSEDTTNVDEVYDTGSMCSNDGCMGQKRVFPDDFKKIKPATKGGCFIDFPNLTLSSCYRAGRAYKNRIYR